jgi:hypothetical protein
MIEMSIFFLFFVVISAFEQMMNGEHNDGQLSDTYLDNIIKQLEISDGSQQTSCVR